VLYDELTPGLACQICSEPMSKHDGLSDPKEG